MNCGSLDKLNETCLGPLAREIKLGKVAAAQVAVAVSIPSCSHILGCRVWT